MKWFLVLMSSFVLTCSVAQERIDGDFSFQTDPAKKYSIYVPTNYDASVPHKLMLGLHPLNTDRWDAVSWCDTLIAFAEANDLLLVCPDGGADGAVDDQIDTAFTTVLLDSMINWYAIDESRIWAMGFSWGGRTTYSYGLRHADRFAGFLPIGAAITGTDQVDGFLAEAADKPFYLVHGANDSPGIRFTPMLNALNANGACVESLLMTGVGHTIDFPNRNQILTDAFTWLENQNCGVNPIGETLSAGQPLLYPNPIQQGDILYLNEWKNIKVIATNGKVMLKNEVDEISTRALPKGIYWISGKYLGTNRTEKIIIQ